MLKMKTSSLSEQSDKRWKIKVITVGHKSAKSQEKKKQKKWLNLHQNRLGQSGLFVRQGMALKLESVIEKCPYYRGVSKKRLDCTY